MKELPNCYCEVLLVLYFLLIEFSEGKDAHGQDVHAPVPFGEALNGLEDLNGKEGTRR